SARLGFLRQAVFEIARGKLVEPGVVERRDDKDFACKGLVARLRMRAQPLADILALADIGLSRRGEDVAAGGAQEPGIPLDLLKRKGADPDDLAVVDDFPRAADGVAPAQDDAGMAG